MTRRWLFLLLLFLVAAGCPAHEDPPIPGTQTAASATSLDTSTSNDTGSTDDAGSQSVCGDGVCDAGEQCDEDCVSDCWTRECRLQQAACVAVSGCGDLIDCVWGCPTEACINRCRSKTTSDANDAFDIFFGCGVQNGCDVAVCGDGRCRPGELCNEDCASKDSCYERCDFTFDNGKPCQCDVNCQQNNDCCSDYQELCVDGAAVCGDGVCESTETELGCPFDCGGEVDQCLGNQCNNALISCYSTPGCPALRVCLESCNDDASCTASCFAQATQSASDALQVLLSCGEQAGCF